MGPQTFLEEGGAAGPSAPDAPTRIAKRKPRPLPKKSLEVETAGPTVDYDPERGRLGVPAANGIVWDFCIEATARAESGRWYLLLSCHPDEPATESEDKLRTYLNQRNGQDWDLVNARLLHRRWGELSEGERERLIRREGFTRTHQLPP